MFALVYLRERFFKSKVLGIDHRSMNKVQPVNLFSETKKKKNWIDLFFFFICAIFDLK